MAAATSVAAMPPQVVGDQVCPSPQEVAVNWNKWIRQVHRWLSIAFTVSVIATFVALAQEEPVIWVSYVPLLPLVLLLFSGLYLFALPYVAKWRGGRRAAREA
ncbi:hypothetical protein [Catellatospora sichuanensis]|uniref:hypothetical protein n=1 Tax=Catellatospora sichuanensis TaxID=1969805 RepID=UPI001FE4840B|nr:hypothetical protein [Catellatospora sichuanensis]